MTKHTLTPFEVTESGTDIEIQDANGTSIAVIIDGNKIPLAQMIVRAVNCHEELLKAMRNAIQRLRDGDGSDSFFPEQDADAIEIMEKAIAKADGK